MTTNTNSHHWKEVENRLRGAFLDISALLTQSKAAENDPAILTGTPAEFLEFLEHNELELAWDVLEEMGRRVQAGQSFWLQLAESAKDMNLMDKAAEALKLSRVQQDVKE